MLLGIVVYFWVTLYSKMRALSVCFKVLSGGVFLLQAKCIKEVDGGCGRIDWRSFLILEAIKVMTDLQKFDSISPVRNLETHSVQ